MSKTLNDFKQEVAKEQGYDSFNEMFFTCIHKSRDVADQAAERYAEYRAKEAIEKYGVAESMAKKESFDNGFMFGHKQGWNEALHWASEQIELGYVPHLAKEEILKGLKP